MGLDEVERRVPRGVRYQDEAEQLGQVVLGHAEGGQLPVVRAQAEAGGGRPEGDVAGVEVVMDEGAGHRFEARPPAIDLVDESPLDRPDPRSRPGREVAGGVLGQRPPERPHLPHVARREDGAEPRPAPKARLSPVPHGVDLGEAPECRLDVRGAPLPGVIRGVQKRKPRQVLEDEHVSPPVVGQAPVHGGHVGPEALVRQAVDGQLAPVATGQPEALSEARIGVSDRSVAEARHRVADLDDLGVPRLHLDHHADRVRPPL